MKTPAKERVLVVGMFGGGSSSLPQEAESLGRLVATTTNWIVLTGGSGPDQRSSAVKHRALIGPDAAGRPWMGLLQSADPIPTPPPSNGFVFKTPLGHKRNYLEAMLCDAAFAFPGGSGTLSEVVAMLCLGRPVVLIGEEQWSAASPGVAGRLPAETKRRWVDETRQKFRAEPRAPAIDDLILRDITVENLADVEQRCALTPASDMAGAVERLAALL